MKKPFRRSRTGETVTKYLLSIISFLRRPNGSSLRLETFENRNQTKTVLYNYFLDSLVGGEIGGGICKNISTDQKKKKNAVNYDVIKLLRNHWCGVI